ncbi:hypothetical protein [Sphingomonas lenta]|uniref:Integrase n=1 Tax=Sphingomonas lenta TaxID=1141887 RepID=A0A2A2SB87_9SPHN|nr:hypothetical protein [Sphingomonas lenta]PAX06450.1 hypothetical protein CKY28_16980 [Sphingomonas lenta]
MSTDKGGVYQRGGFWLDLVRGAGGEPLNDNWYIWWYDSERGRQRRKTTGTNNVRLACDKLDEHYLATFRPTAADQAVYDVSTALTDYFVEHGQKQISAEAIKARLKLMSRFIDHEAQAGRLATPFLPDHIDDYWLSRFREWALAEPIVSRRKDASGQWVAGSSRPRTASSTEESIIQLKAALNHAFRRRRIRYVPPLKHKTRAAVTPVRTYRLSMTALGEMIDFTVRGSGNYAGHADRLLSLRRYLIAAICTLARPDAIFDMSVLKERGQWLRADHRFSLNPEGRAQTKKHRPIVPVNDLLHVWLDATDEWFVCRERLVFEKGQEIERVEQIGVRSVKSGWDTMRTELRIPAGWGPKLIRHSMASELRRRRADPWELAGQLGHRVLKTSEIYAIYDPDYLSTVQAAIDDVLADLRRSTGDMLPPRTRPPLPSPVDAGGHDERLTRDR